MSPVRNAVIDTTADTTQDATPRNTWQPRAKEIGLSKLILQHRATLGNRCQRIVALRRSRVRAPSVTLFNTCPFAGKTREVVIGVLETLGLLDDSQPQHRRQSCSPD